MSLQHKKGGCAWDLAPWEAIRTAGTHRAYPPYLVDRASGPEAPGLKVPVAMALGMSLRISRTQVATSMFICLARWNAFPGNSSSVTLAHPGNTKAPGLSLAPTHTLTLLLGEDFLLPSEPGYPLNDRVAEGDLGRGANR